MTRFFRCKACGYLGATNGGEWRMGCLGTCPRGPRGCSPDGTMVEVHTIYASWYNEPPPGVSAAYFER